MRVPKILRVTGRKEARASSVASFERGTRSIADLVAPAAVEVSRGELRADESFARTLALTAYPRTVSPGWLTPLLAYDRPLELSFHVRPLDSAAMITKLTRKLAQMESGRRMDAHAGRVSDAAQHTGLRDAERVRSELQEGTTKLFSVGTYFLLRSRSREELGQDTERLQGWFAGRMASTRTALFEQDSGFHSVLPEGFDRLCRVRNLDTGSLATMFPFVSGSLSAREGILYGVAVHDRSLVIFDPFDESLENANAVVFAQSGAGKSYFTKLLALRSLMTGVEFIVVDPENEYTRLCEAVGGQVVRLGPGSPEHINPLDLPDGGARDPQVLAEQVVSLVGWLEMLLSERGQGLTSYERAILDKSLYRMYSRFESSMQPPVLSDLLTELDRTEDAQARGIAARLERYVTGSLSALFNHRTDVDLDGRLVVFNVHDVGPELRPLAVHTISRFVWQRVSRSLRPRLLVIDEAWSLMQHEEGGRFLAELARRARKRYLGVVAITQDIGDFLESPYGKTVLGMSAMKLLMKHDGSSIGPVTRAFGLSDIESRVLLEARKGEGLFCARGSRVPLMVTASPAEHELITTSPRELAQRQTAQGGSR